MKKQFIITLAILLTALTTIAQSLGDFKPEEKRGAYGPRKFPSKDVFIAEFAVHYQVMSDRTATNKGSKLLVKGVMGKASASLTVGLDIPAETLQQITDEAYRNFVATLQSKGFNVLTAADAKNTDYYKNYTLSNNLAMIPSTTLPGGITVHPQSVGFFYKESGFGQTYTKLSAELDDANIFKIDLYVLFLDSKTADKGFGAKVAAETKLCLSAYDHVKSITTNNSITTKMGITGSKSEKTGDINSLMEVICGRNKIGGSPLGSYTGALKKSLDINDVIEDQKIKSVASSDYDNVGKETPFGRVYTAQNNTSSSIATITVDAGKYETGVVSAINTFLTHHADEFKTKFF